MIVMYLLFIFCRKERNILEAAAAGASSSIKLVANIAANLIAFLAMLEFVNAVLSWFGGFVGYPEFSFQVDRHKNKSEFRITNKELTAENML